MPPKKVAKNIPSTERLDPDFLSCKPFMEKDLPLIVILTSSLKAPAVPSLTEILTLFHALVRNFRVPRPREWPQLGWKRTLPAMITLYIQGLTQAGVSESF